MSEIVFAIKTIPDIEGGRRLYKLQDLSDKEVANVMYYKRRQETENSEFLRLHLHRICAISVAILESESFQTYVLGESGSEEAELIQQFFELIETLQPRLISWNGSAFDLPVLHYRALVHAISAPQYWRREHHNAAASSHIDLMTLLAGESSHADVPLDELATLLGFPGLPDQTLIADWETYRHGGIETIRQQSQTRVLNNTLTYLRFQLFRGQLSREDYDTAIGRVREALQQQQTSHLNAFLSAWSV